MDYKYNENTGKFEEGWSFRKSSDIIGAAERVIAQYKQMEARCERLHRENEELKSGIWKEKEMKRLRDEYERMREDYYRGFPITKEEEEKIRKFKAEHHQPFVSGGGYTYTFVPTSLGTSGTITAMNGDTLQFQEIG